MSNKKSSTAINNEHCFCKYPQWIRKKNILTEKIPFNTPFVEKGEDIIRMTLYSFHRPFEALQADIAYISFLAKSAVDTKFCLLFIDLFTSKIYTCPI